MLFYSLHLLQRLLICTALYGFGGILQTNYFSKGLTAADENIKYDESDFQIVNDTLICMVKDQGSKGYHSVT
jgi:hypothetical protein